MVGPEGNLCPGVLFLEKGRLVLGTFDQRLDVHIIEEKRNILLVKTVQGSIDISWLEQVRSCREAGGGKDRQQINEQNEGTQSE
ncbi:hypothetical protein JCM39068_07150 [Desulfocastanea catecholica]